jgi:hypothetical protein
VSAAGALVDADLERRAAAPELLILRAQRASRLPPAIFALLVGAAVSAGVTGPLLGPGIDPADIVASGLFFGVSVAVLVGFTPRIFPGAAADLRRLAPILPLDDAELETAARALTRATPRSVAAMTALGVLLGLLHAWLLGLTALPPVSAVVQGTATVALWVAMFWTVPPLLENASLFSRLGAAARVDLFRPGLLAPFGAAALRPTLFVIGMMCAYPLLAVGSDGLVALGPSFLGFVASFASAFGLFFLPLRGIRRRIVAARTETLAAADARIAALRADDAPTAPPTDGARLAELEALLALRARVARTSSWPLDLAGVRRVLLYGVLPPLTWAAAALVEMAIDARL